MIKVQLYHHRKTDSMTDAKRHKQKERERTRQEYYFAGKQICRETFAFAHAVSRKTVDAIARTLDSQGFAPRTHGNTGKTPKHALTVQDVQNIKHFLRAYGNKNGLPLPGRLPNFRNNKVILLPSDKTKSDIHQFYLEAANELDLRKVCLSQFKAVWLNQCPNLVIATPATDLCAKCQDFASVLSNGGNLTEEEKADKLLEYNAHIAKAKVQRDYYREQCEEGKSNFNTLTTEQQPRGMLFH